MRVIVAKKDLSLWGLWKKNICNNNLFKKKYYFNLPKRKKETFCTMWMLVNNMLTLSTIVYWQLLIWYNGHLSKYYRHFIWLWFCLPRYENHLLSNMNNLRNKQATVLLRLSSLSWLNIPFKDRALWLFDAVHDAWLSLVRKRVLLDRPLICPE